MFTDSYFGVALDFGVQYGIQISGHCLKGDGSIWHSRAVRWVAWVLFRCVCCRRAIGTWFDGVCDRVECSGKEWVLSLSQ